jgi:threonine dehydratase
MAARAAVPVLAALGVATVCWVAEWLQPGRHAFTLDLAVFCPCGGGGLVAGAKGHPSDRWQIST